MQLRIATPDGELVSEMEMGLSADKTLATMLSALEKHPEYNQPSEIEQKYSPFQKAIAAMELRDFDAAKEVLKDSKRESAYLLLARIARYEKNWSEMDKLLENVTSNRRSDDAMMERAHGYWQRREFEKLKEATSEITSDSNRYSESRYYLGLAHYHLGDRDAALKAWRDHVENTPADNWVYQSDYAHSGVLNPDPTAGGGGADPTSVLGRIGYLGASSSDLVKDANDN